MKFVDSCISQIISHSSQPTSALDKHSELKVQQSLQKLICNIHGDSSQNTSKKTSIIIAHRLSTIIDSDIIFVMDCGQIVESGTHDTLMALNGTYTRLITAQLTGEEESASGSEL